MCLYKFAEPGHPSGKRIGTSKVFDTIQQCYRKGMTIASTSSGTFSVTGGVLLTGGSSIHTCLTEGSRHHNPNPSTDRELKSDFGVMRLGLASPDI